MPSIPEPVNTVNDDTIEVGEATLATVSLTSVLKGEMPKVGIGLQKQIVGMDRRIDALARDFVNDSMSGKFVVPRPFTYTKLLDRFTHPLSEGELTAIIKKFPQDAHEVALSFMSTLQSAYTHLADMVPVSDYDTYLGPKRIMPTDDKLFDFWLQYWIVDDPLIVFRLMNRGGLIPEQIETLKLFYPSLYNYMMASILDAMVRRQLREPSFMNLPPRADRGLAVFKQQRVVEYGVNVHVTPPDKPTVARTPPPKLDKGLQSKAQSIEAVAP